MVHYGYNYELNGGDRRLSLLNFSNTRLVPMSASQSLTEEMPIYHRRGRNHLVHHWSHKRYRAIADLPSADHRRSIHRPSRPSTSHQFFMSLQGQFQSGDRVARLPEEMARTIGLGTTEGPPLCRGSLPRRIAQRSTR